MRRGLIVVTGTLVVGVLTLGLWPASSTWAQQRPKQITGAKIESLVPSSHEVLEANESFYVKVEIGAMSIADMTKEVRVDHFICLRDIATGELKKTFSGGIAIAGHQTADAGKQSGQYLVADGLPLGEYEAIAFVLVKAGGQPAFVVDMRSSRFRLQARLRER